MTLTNFLKAACGERLGAPCRLYRDRRERALFIAPALSAEAAARLRAAGWRADALSGGGTLLDPPARLWRDRCRAGRADTLSPERRHLCRLLARRAPPLAAQDAEVLRRGLTLYVKGDETAFLAYCAAALADSLRLNTPAPSALGDLIAFGGTR